MKTFKKFIIIGLIAALMAAVAAFTTGCGETTVTISFDTNGGSAVAPLTVEIGGEFDMPATTRSGYVFEGWYTDGGFSGSAVTGRVTASEEKTYYAKWSALYTLTLDTAGGTLSEKTFSLKAGENVYDKVKDLTPGYAHHEFDGWYDGSRKVSASTVMPASNLTLTASYKVEYDIELYTQTEVGGSQYVKYDTVTGYDKAGKNFTAEYDLNGYTHADHANARTDGRLDEDYTKNVFRLYFDVETFKVTFYSNYPKQTGLTADTRTATYVSGAKMAAPYDYFAADGYVLVGWAESLTGSVKYNVDYLCASATNADEAAKCDEITVTKNLALFAVWKKGFYNLFGGGDVIYYPHDNSTNIYLERGGLYFMGMYLARNNYFDFTDKNGNVMLEGKLTDAEGNDVTADTLATSAAAFEIRNEERDTSSYNLYKVGTGINKYTQIVFDEYNGVTYSVRNQIPSQGIYYLEDGFYVINYYSGPLADTRMIIKTNDSGDVKTFRVRNETEFGYGTILRGVVVENELRFYNAEVAYGLTMDGFGNAVYDNAGATVSFSYSETENEGEYTLLREDVEVGVIRVYEGEGFNYYMFYFADYAYEYVAEGGETLALDGVNTLTFTYGDTSYDAYYTTAESAFDGDIVTFFDAAGGKHVYLIKAVTFSDGLDGGTGQSVTEYVAEQKDAGYAEYYFKDGSNIYYGPMVVMGGDSRSGIKTEVWMRTSAGKFAKVSDGLVTTNAAGHYVYTETTKFAVEDATVKPIDFATVKAFEFEVGSVTAGGGVYNVNYWYNYTDNDGETHNNTITYTSGNRTFTVIMPLGAESENLILSDVGVYFDGTTTYNGTYAVGDDGSISLKCIVSVQTAYGQSSREQTFYFRVNGDSLTVLENAPHRTALRKADGNYDNAYLYFDGESGKATLVTFDTADGSTISSYDGTVALTGNTSSLGYAGFDVYTFTAEGFGSFDYVVYSTAGAAFFIRYAEGLELRYPAGSGLAYVYDEVYNGQFTSDYGYLRLDGFGIRAEYSFDGGDTVGSYSVNENGELRLYAGGRYRYFDLDAATATFTARGEEYGVYVLRDNNYNKNLYFDFDGYGKLAVFTVEGGVKNYVDENGTYTCGDDGSVTISYRGGANAYTKGFLLTVSDSDGSVNAFVPYSDEVAGTYINNKNWAVLVIDSAGRAKSYDKNGFESSGRVTVVTDSLLYFADDNGEDGSVFNYNKDTRVISAFSSTQRAYYTADFKSLIFLKNGFVVVSGQTVGYYTVTGGSVVIYRQTGEGKYGFTADTAFGSFTDVSDYNGERYYYNPGRAMTFERDLSTGNYKLSLNGELSVIGDLYFTPPGTETFTNVLGDIEIDGKFYACRMTRTADGMYATIGLSDGSNYRIYMTADYRGTEASTYYVTGVERVRYIYSARYLTNYFMYYYYYGSAAAQSYTNNYGTIEIVDTYDENGEVISSYAEGKFGSASEFYDYNGDKLTFKAPYELHEEVSAGRDMYVVRYVAGDGFTYNVYIFVENHPYMNRPAYFGYFGREEVVSTADGVYEVTVERMAANDMGLTNGSLSDISFKKNGEKIENGAAALVDGVIYYIVRGETGATYYFIEVKYENTGEIGNVDGMLRIDGVTVTEKSSVTYYTEDGEDYVDFIDGKLTLLSVTTGSGKKSYIVIEYEYDEVTGAYTVSTSENVYTVTIVDGKAVITFVEKEKEEEKPQA